MTPPLAALRATHAGPGRLVWIGLRPARRAAMAVPERAVIGPLGLEGDRYAGRDGARAVTLIQWEHLAVIAALAGRATLDPALLRRNLAVAGINLTALKTGPFRVGDAVLQITGACHPCSKMETALGPGGYNAMRGHGGWCARIVRPGAVALQDDVAPEADPAVARDSLT